MQTTRRTAWGVALSFVLAWTGCDDSETGTQADGSVEGGSASGGNDSSTGGAADGGGSGGDAGDSGGSGSSGSGGSDSDAGSGGAEDAGGTGSNGSGESACGAGCDDGIDCTQDECVEGTCIHRLDDSACDEGKSCDIQGKGCVAGAACATAEDCDFPACSQNRACDAVLAACVYDALDGDGDGFAPTNCGGADCNDDDDSVFPGQPELCNGGDDNCDGKADETAECPGEGQICNGAGTEDAQCGCPETSNTCQLPFGGVACVDTATDAEHCGECNNSCGSGGKCVSGGCTCPDSATECLVVSSGGTTGFTGGTGFPGGTGIPGGVGAGLTCADTQNDPAHCGGCNQACSSGMCAEGECIDCGAPGQPCCSLTGCGLSGICEGTPGDLDSECFECGQEAGQPCCSSSFAGETFEICLGDVGGAQTGAVCGDSGKCVDL